ncbi:hypothetical protein HK097_007634 [Rhizophlyctis rosea]|uniref:TRAF-type domain-containing protein n=1 Tax=Rhizophlyctis rosea TaxID=64517 RepID=A0AAD5X250_9FUNG|nr:hypothetical protein HK097_007634 [Rhizophlyctis rosea]
MSGIQKYDYVSRDSIPSRLIDPISNLPLVNPVELPCAHIFSKQPLVERLAENAFCPTCRHQCDENDIDSITERLFILMLEDLTVRCTNNKAGSGCTWTGPRKDLANHLTPDCPFDSIPCDLATSGCTWTGDRQNLQTHLATCGFVQIDCQHKSLECRWTGQRQHPDNHLKTCDFVTVHCSESLEGCPWEGLRSTLSNHLSTCNFVKIPCEYAELGGSQMCLHKDKRMLMENHVERCNYRIVVSAARGILAIQQQQMEGLQRSLRAEIEEVRTTSNSLFGMHRLLAQVERLKERVVGRVDGLTQRDVHVLQTIAEDAESVLLRDVLMPGNFPSLGEASQNHQIAASQEGQGENPIS